MDRNIYISIENQEKILCCNCKKEIFEDEFFTMSVEINDEIVNYNLCPDCNDKIEPTDLFFVCPKCREINFYKPEDVAFAEVDGNLELCEILTESYITPLKCRFCEMTNQ